MVKGGIRTSKEEVKEKGNEEKKAGLAETVKALSELVEEHETRIKRLEDEIW